MSEAPYLKPSPDADMVTIAIAANWLDGKPIEGNVELSYNSTEPMLDDDPTLPISIYPKAVRIPLTTTTVLIDNVPRTVGYMSVSIPASNDPDLQGSGGTYTFSESWGGGRKNVSFVADKDAPGVIWLNRIAGADSTPALPVSAVYYSDFTALTDRVQTLEQSGVGGGVALTDYTDQVASLPDYPTSFPPDLTGVTPASIGALPDTYTPPAAPNWSNIAGKPAVVAEGASQAAARTAIGAKADSYTPSVADVPALPTSKIAGLVTTLTSKADLVGGTVPTSQLPALALTNTQVVASQAAMLALTPAQVQPGDIAVRTDGAGTFILTATDPSALASWTRLNSPTDLVSSVNGQVGAVTLSAANIGAATTAQGTLADSAVQPEGLTKTAVGLPLADNTSDANKPISTATQTALNGKAASDHAHVAPEITATAAVTIVQSAVVVVGQGSASAQTVELRHVTANGLTVTLMQTVTVPANSVAAITPAAFSQAFARGDRLRAVRTAGTGKAPAVTVNA